SDLVHPPAQVRRPQRGAGKPRGQPLREAVRLDEPVSPFDLDADRGWQRDVKPDAGSDPPLAGRCQETDLQRVAPRLSDHFDQLVVGSRGPRAVAEGADRVVDYDRVAVAGEIGRASWRERV